METILLYTSLVVFGLIIGSFLTVCIYRIPIGRFDDEPGPDEPEPEKAEEETKESKTPLSPFSPSRSFCPSCNKQLRWWHNIPVFSWVFLRGRCAYCSCPISFRYPLVELLSAAACVLSYQSFGLSATGFVVYVFVCALIVITFIDYDFYIIPDLITYPGVLFGLAIAAVNQFWHVFTEPVVPSLFYSLLGFLFGAGFLYLVSEVYLRVRKIEGLGLGDVKLLAMTGALFGPECSLYTIFLGSMIGSVCGLLLVLLQSRKLSQHLPFGPYLAFGTVSFLFMGNSMLVFCVEIVRSFLELFV